MATTPLPPPHYIFTFPGAPVRICLQLEVVRNLQEILAPLTDSKDAVSVERNGILLGQLGGGSTEVMDVLELPGDLPGAIAASLPRLRKSRDLVPVGFYRTQSDDDLHLSDQDFDIASEYFSDASNVFLVIHQSNAGPDKATFFFWDNGRIHRDFPILEFPFDVHVLAVQERQRARNAHRIEALPERVAEADEDLKPSPPVPPVPPVVAHRRWKAVALVGIVAILLLATGVLLPKFYPSITANTNRTPIAAVAPALGLKFQHQGADLLVTWDRGAANRYGAAAGLLSIRDAGDEKAIGLNAEQLRSANVLLSPSSDQVQIQLTLLLSGQKTLSESAMAILPSRGSPDGVIQSVAIPPKPVTSAQITAHAPPVVPTRSFTAPAERANAAPLVDTPPPVTTPALGRGLEVSIPTAAAPVPSPIQPAEHAPLSVAPTSPLSISPPPSAAAPSQTAKVDDVRPAAFVKGQKPEYPLLARQSRVQGTVVVEALIGPDGKVKQTTAVSGPMLLREAARRAVNDWVFRPAMLNGKTIEGPARVEVNFRGEW